MLATLPLSLRLAGVGHVNSSVAVASVVPGTICPATPAACAVARQCAWGEAIEVVPYSLADQAPPSLRLDGSSALSSCDNLTLAVKPAGAAAAFTWGLVAGPSAPLLDSFLEASGGYASRLHVASHLFGDAGTYVFEVNATDYRGVAAEPARLAVAKSPSVSPSVRIVVPSGSRAVASQPIVIRADVRAPCISDLQQLSFAWHLSIPSADPNASVVRTKLSGSRQIVLPAETLPARVASVIELEVGANTPDLGLLTASAVVTLTPPLEPLVARIAGGASRSVSVARAVVLDGSSSRDPSSHASRPSTLTYQWSCANAQTETEVDVAAGGASACLSVNGSLAAARLLALPVLTLPPFTLLPDIQYTFLLSVFSSINRRIAVASVNISALATTPPPRRC